MTEEKPQKFEFEVKPIGKMTMREFMTYADEFGEFFKQVGAYAEKLSVALKVFGNLTERELELKAAIKKQKGA